MSLFVSCPEGTRLHPPSLRPCLLSLSLSPNVVVTFCGTLHGLCLHGLPALTVTRTTVSITSRAAIKCDCFSLCLSRCRRLFSFFLAPQKSMHHCKGFCIADICFLLKWASCQESGMSGVLWHSKINCDNLKEINAHCWITLSTSSGLLFLACCVILLIALTTVLVLFSAHCITG